MTISEVQDIENKITKPILFLSGVHVPEVYWIRAEQLVLDIDPKDTPYVAFSMFFKTKIWSGDKVLRNGLILKGFKKVITTEELFEMRSLKRES